MRIEPISDPADRRLADYVSLRDAELRTSIESEYGLFLAEGAKVVRRAVDAGYDARSFLMAPRRLETLADVLDRAGDVPCYVAEPDLIEQVTGFHVHRGALAAFIGPAGEHSDRARRRFTQRHRRGGHRLLRPRFASPALILG